MGKLFMFLSERGFFKFLLKLSARLSAYFTTWALLTILISSTIIPFFGSVAGLVLVAVITLSGLWVLIIAITLELLLGVRQNVDRLADELTEIRCRLGEG